jgi:hypothetical protein
MVNFPLKNKKKIFDAVKMQKDVIPLVIFCFILFFDAVKMQNIVPSILK